MFSVLFYLTHNYLFDVGMAKIQMNYDKWIDSPELDLLPNIDPISGKLILFGGNIRTDSLPFFTNTTVLETYQLGFGEFCSITDQLIEDINDVINHKKYNIHKRFHNLPLQIKGVFFPKFLTNNYSAFDFSFNNINSYCNPKCHSIPKFDIYSSTPEGRRQLSAFDQGLLPPLLGPLAIIPQYYYYLMIDELNKYRYCSPNVL